MEFPSGQIIVRRMPYDNPRFFERTQEKWQKQALEMIWNCTVKPASAKDRAMLDYQIAVAPIMEYRDGSYRIA
jgi:hypothetical protein